MAVHKSKNVSRLYQQRDIRILVNADPAGFASAAYAVHGTFAYAMALAVDDAAQAYNGSGADAEPFQQAVAEGELEIPAIRVSAGLDSPDRSQSPLGHFSEIDFEQVQTEKDLMRGCCGSTAAQTVGYDEMLTWLPFYTSIFETSKRPSSTSSIPAVSCAAR